MAQAILLVDGSSLGRDDHAAFLRDLGYDVAQARDVPSAVRDLELRRPALVVIDDLTPGFRELVRTIEGGEFHVPIVLLAGPSGGELRLAEPSVVVPKPVTQATLSVRIHALMHGLTGDLPSPGPDVRVEDALAQLKAEYASTLPERVDRLGRLLAEAESSPAADQLRIAHRAAVQLEALADTFAVDGVSRQAGRIEQGLREMMFGGLEPHPIVFADFKNALDEARGSLSSAPPAPALEPVDDLVSVLAVGLEPELETFLTDAARRKLVKVHLARDALEAERRCRERRIDCALINFDGLGDSDPLELLAHLRAIANQDAMPIGYYAESPSLSERAQAVLRGANLFVHRPPSELGLLDAIAQLAAHRRVRAPHVLLIDADLRAATQLARGLSARGCRVTVRHHPARIAEDLTSLAPDVLLIASVLPLLTGQDVTRVLRSSREWVDLPVIVLGKDDRVEERLAAIEAGADDVFQRPLDENEVHARVQSAWRRSRLRSAADAEAQVAAVSRRFVVEAVGAWLAGVALPGAATSEEEPSDDLGAPRPSAPPGEGEEGFGEQEQATRDIVAPGAIEVPDLTISLVEIHDYVGLREARGQLAAERVVATLGSLISTRFRPTDVRARWGASSFVVALFGQRLEGTKLIVAKIFDELGRIEFESPTGRFQVALSAGVAAAPADGRSAEVLLGRAERRLAQARVVGAGAIVP